MAISLFIAGDVVPKGVQPEVFKSKGAQIFNEMRPYIKESDYAIVNLEAPVINGKPSPIKKSGPNLGVATSTVDVLKEVGFNIITLANNHFFDQEQPGVDWTLNKINECGIRSVGGGPTYF